MQHTRREIFEKDTRMNQTTISKRHDPVHSVSVSWLRLWLYFFLLVTALGITVAAVDTDTDTTTTLDHSYDEEIRKHLELFHYSEMVQVIGPSRFPAPTEVALVREEETTTMIVPYLQPIAGHHRPSVDVVVAFAAEYPLSNYVTFIESLRATGFTGDVVLAISPLDQRKTDVWEYLTEPNNHVVLYAPVLVCYNAEGEAVDSAKGGSRVCKADHLFAQKDRNTGTVTPIPDPRPPRTVQTLRYEIYWLMIAFHTNPHAWILLVDARDTIFQTNPFASVPRRRRRTTINTNNSTVTLYFLVKMWKPHDWDVRHRIANGYKPHTERMWPIFWPTNPPYVRVPPWENKSLWKHTYEPWWPNRITPGRYSLEPIKDFTIFYIIVTN
jgi:hypothetical protein